ncbi:MAG TPA: histidine kinase [Ignavibacteria bacterium]
MKQKEMEKQLISNELALLRSQINPQFLFNTLTNIKSLIELQPEKAIYSIENLSEIMSYMLYETSADKVLLDDEIDYINNYLNLQSVRYNPDFISFEVTGNTTGLLVPPMIFMPFIENVFTFGDSIPRTPGVAIKLNIIENVLSFEIMNHTKENTDKDKSGSGYNIKSSKRCLDLLFGNKYNLDIKNENNKYLIKLKIKLIA